MKKDLMEQVLLDFIAILKDTKAFVLDQAPSVMSEALIYARIKYTVMFILYLLTLIRCTKWFLYFNNSRKDEFVIMSGAIMLIVVFAGLIMATENFGPLVQCWFAPKLYLLSYFKELIH